MCSVLSGSVIYLVMGASLFWTIFGCLRENFWSTSFYKYAQILFISPWNCVTSLTIITWSNVCELLFVMLHYFPRALCFNLPGAPLADLCIEKTSAVAPGISFETHHWTFAAAYLVTPIYLSCLSSGPFGCLDLASLVLPLNIYLMDWNSIWLWILSLDKKYYLNAPKGVA